MYSLEDRSQVITIGGVEHKLILTTKATKDITKRYGGLEKLGDKLLKNATMEESLGEVIWLIALLANQMMNGNLIISVINSKQEKRNVALVTTKPDKENHGRGVKSIRKVVDKYDGTIEFEDKGDTFEVTGILYEVG